MPDGSEGNRTQYIISALITAMTDNAKERMAAKLGLNKSALAVVANMTALGVPLKTSVLLINNPVVKKMYYLAANEGRSSIKGSIDIALKKLKAKSIYPREVNDGLLIEQIEEDLSLDEILALEDEVGTSKASALFSTLAELRKAIEIAEYTGKVSSIMNLSSGLGRDIRAVKNKIQDVNDLGVTLSEEAYKRL